MSVAPVTEHGSPLPAEGGGGLDDDLLSGPAWGRHPTDLVRLLGAALAFGLTLPLAVRHPAEVRSVSVDVVDMVNRLPGWVRDVLLGSTQLLAILVPIAMVAVLARAPRLLSMAVGSALVAAAAMATVQQRVDDAVPHQVVAVTERQSWIIGAAFPSGAYLAGFTAVVVVLGPVLSLGWRRVAVGGLAIASFGRVITAVAVPLNLAITIALGAVVGSAALAALGSPRRRSSRRAVLEALASAGFPADRIDPVERGARHAQTFRAVTESGRPAFVKLLGRDERDADLIVRVIKRLRVKDLDDERPSWTPGRLVQHEALSAMLAGRQGAAVPGVVAAGTTEGGDGVLALDPVLGDRLDQLALDDVTDELLDVVWQTVAALHRQGIAHRWLTANHLLVQDTSPPTATLIDFRWAIHQADVDQLGADVAMLVTSLALIVGAERSVAAAARAVGPAELAAALPLVQPLALPSDLRDAIRGQRALLPAVRSRLQDAAGGEPYRLADIERVSLRQVASLLGLVVVAYSLLSLVASRSAIQHAFGAISPWDLPFLVVLAAVPFVAGAATFASVVPKPLPFGELVRLMVGQSFLNRFTPANAGGMALQVRYLQKRGIDFGGAAAGVALTSVANGITQAVVLATFAAWAGSAGGRLFSLPRASSIAVWLVVVAALAALVWLTPWGRRVVGRRISTTGKQVWRTLARLSRQPARFVTLFGTSLIGRIAAIAAFAASCRAVDISLALPRLGLLYLTAATVASAAPTPGGLGAIEAALTVALTGAGVPSPDAVSAVFLFRLVTYWLPVPFGWWSLHHLERTILTDT